ncbi:hypothetical protein [Rahnella perminowiae]|uniref:hypothetical protein n=1 Tax=Rahnella perminowiae TaxID=2816244 RepID=UPI00215C1190|nr:hypothetical protein [Rahnella perminowiae]MCR8998648.1 hypothetical protein [Rahnella perminowiae]MCR8998708.1 hypothetical protein [Rahnella perminowiae]
MTFTTLRESDFIDLYLGDDYAEIKGLVGGAGLLIPVPENLKDDVKQLHELCIAQHFDTGRSEFSCFYDSRLYRVTVSHDLFSRTSLVLRQTPAEIRNFADVPLSTPLRRSVELPAAAGLF